MISACFRGDFNRLHYCITGSLVLNHKWLVFLKNGLQVCFPIVYMQFMTNPIVVVFVFLHFISLSRSKPSSGFPLQIKSSSNFLTKLRYQLKNPLLRESSLSIPSIMNLPLYPVFFFIPDCFLIALITICNVCVCYLFFCPPPSLYCELHKRRDHESRLPL